MKQLEKRCCLKKEKTKENLIETKHLFDCLWKQTKKEMTDFFATSPHASRDVQLFSSKREVRTAHFDKATKSYRYERACNMISVGGLHKAIKRRYHPHYNPFAKTKKRWPRIGAKGSNKKIGKRVDNDILAFTKAGSFVQPKGSKRLHHFTKELVEYWSQIRHTPETAQLPVEIRDWNIMTQADFITYDAATGKRWLWEVKTGLPRNFGDADGKFASPLETVPCTKYGIWQLQLHYTRAGLEAAGLHIDESRVIQVYGKKGSCVLKIYSPPAWIKKLAPLTKHR